MPILDAADRSDFLRRQALTSRNVRGGRLTDLALGGLNYQIEHHLFPSMPRPNLRRSQALIEAFCKQQDVPYCESSLAGSYAQALRHLNAVGRPARPAPRPRREPGLKRSRAAKSSRETAVARPGESGRRRHRGNLRPTRQ
jgi:fatty acid desaturase